MATKYPLGDTFESTPTLEVNPAAAGAASVVNSPEQETKVYGVALETNTPPALLQNETPQDLDALESGALDYDQIARDNPALAKLYTDTHSATLAKDEHQQLVDTSFIASQFRGMKSAAKFVGSLPAGAESGLTRFMLINNRREQERLMSEYEDIQAARRGEISLESLQSKYTDTQAYAQGKLGAEAPKAPASLDEWENSLNERVKRNGERIQQLASRKAIFERPAGYAEVAQASSTLEALKRIDAETFGFTIGESLAQDPVAMATNIALAPFGGFTAGVARAGVQAESIFALNYELETLDNLAKNNVDVTSAAALYEYYQSEKFKKESEASTAKGAVDAGINAGVSLASGFLRAPSAITLGALSGPSGEYFGELAAGREPTPGGVVMEALGDTPFTIIEAYTAATNNAGVQTIDVKAYNTLIGRAQVGFGKAAEAMDFGAAVDQFTTSISSLKLLQRDPTVAHKFVEDLTDQGAPKDVFFDPEALQQAGVDMTQLAQISPTFAARAGEAMATGGAVQIPFSEYATMVAPTMGNVLNDHVRGTPDGFSRAEAEVFMQTQAELIKTEAENIAAEAKLSEPFEQSIKNVEDNIFGQLTSANRFTETVNRFYAKLTASAFAVNGARLGMSAEQFFNDFGGLNIVAEQDATPEVFTQTYKGMDLESDGRLKVTHFTTQSGLTQLDPAKWGETLAALPRSERNRIGLAPNRAYAYLGNDFKKENQLGDVRYTGFIDPAKFYDLETDPQGLRQIGAQRAQADGTDRETGLERAILDAGFDGYITKAPQGGYAVASYKPIDVIEGDVNAQGTREAGAEGFRNAGDVRRSAELLDAARRADTKPLENAPGAVEVAGRGKVEFGPNATARAAAEAYMRSTGRIYQPPKKYVKIDKTRAKRIAQAFEDMKHEPLNPVVEEAYRALIDETLAQYQYVKATGLKIEFLQPGQEDPYAATPRLAILDVNENNHLWVFPTDFGFGGESSAAIDISGNPLLQLTNEYVDGRQLRANDVFRIVHDYFGHIKDGVGFRAEGEENAWQSHAAMFSPIARRALTTETRGQNSWVNFGPYSEKNLTASGADTDYAPQKIGLLPEWVSQEGFEGGIDSGREGVYNQLADDTQGQVEGFAGGLFYSNMYRVFSQKLNKTGTPKQYREQIAAFIKGGLIKQAEYDWSGLPEWLDYAEREISTRTEQKVYGFINEAGQFEARSTKQSEQNPIERTITPSSKIELSSLLSGLRAGYFDLGETILEGNANSGGVTLDELQYYGSESVSRFDDAQRAEEISIRFNDLYDQLQENGPKILSNGQPDLYSARLFMLDENDQPYKDENGKWVLDEIEVSKEAADIVNESDTGAYEETINVGGDEWKLRFDFETGDIELFDPEGDSVQQTYHPVRSLSAFGDAARSVAEDYFINNEIVTYDKGEGDTRFSQYIEPGEKSEYKEFLINLPGINDVGVSQHFDDTPSVLMHIRATGRTDTKNKKVLFIEEIQSDWHQQGYKRGYDSELRSRYRTVQDANGVWRVEYKDENNSWSMQEIRGVVGWSTQEAAREAASLGRRDIRAVADAPLIKEWPTVALKRMIGYAVENGYEGVAWTTGEMQKKRYASAPADRYDTELPSLAAKLLKKYDAKPEMLDVRLDSPEDAPGFYINDRLKEAINSATDGAFSLFQKTEAQPRGTFNPKTNTIALLKAANLSTFIHESGHLFLEMLAFASNNPNATPEIEGDMQAALKWMGVSDITGNRMEVWNTLTLEQKRPFHEKWARGFEAYLFEGKAPTLRLADVFRRMKSWLVRTYKDIVNLDVELDSEIRGVFDRMVATSDQIKEAENARAYDSLFDDQVESGMVEEEFRTYEALQLTATQEALEELQKRSLRDMQWMSNAKAREIRKLQKKNAAKRRELRDEVTSEIMRQPEYQAIKFLKTGQYEVPEGANKEVRDAYLETSVQNHKLSLPVLKEMYGEEGNALWRFLQGGKYGFASNEGMHPDAVATMFGYDSGDAMVRAILAAPDFRETVEGMTDQRMLEQYGDLIDERAIERAAEKAIHNEARAKVIATEMNALQKATGKPRIMAEAAKAYAEDAVNKLLVREIRPGQYTRHEAKAAREASDAFRKGDIETAAIKKRAQLLQHYSAKAAFNALDDVEKAVRYFKKFNKAKVKNVSPEYLDQIQQLLDRYELTTTTLKALDKRKSLRDFVAAQQELGVEPNIPADILEAAERKNYREATVEELRGLYDTIKQIEHLGRLKDKLLTAKDERDFNTLIDAVVTNIRAEGPKRVLDNTTKASNWEASKLNFKGYLAMHRKVASIGRQLDGFKDGGIFWDNFIRTMNEKGAKEATMREETTQKLFAIIQPLLSNRPFADAFGSKKEYFESVGRSLNREERLAIALNVGNSGNLQRLLDGEGWTPEQLKPILDSLTKEEWDTVQQIWDLFETFRPEIAAKEKRVYGVEPKWVEPAPIITPFGEYRGGYYPIKYDGRRNDKAAAFNEAEEAKQMLKGAFLSATTRRSFTKARADEVKGRPLLYTMDGLYSGLNDVIHDLAWHEWVIDMNRMLRDGRVSSAVRDIYGDSILRQIKTGVRDIAGGDALPADPFERFLADMRAGATIAGLGFNLVNSVINITGITQSISRIGARWMLVGLREMSVRPRGLVEEVHERSDMMRTRMKTRGREINEIQSVIRGKSTARQKMDNLMFAPMYLTQMMVDTPTWWGAYQKNLLEFGDEAKAAALADQAVIDAQSGGQTKDLAAIQRGNAYMKLFTTFYGYFSATYNLAVEKTRTTDFTNPSDVVRLGGDYLLLAVVPGIMTALIKTALNGDDDDWELDKLAAKMAGESASFVTGTMVGVREFSGIVQMLSGTNYGPGGYGGPAGLRFFSEIYKLANQASQGEADEAFMKAFINVMGIIFKLPSAQINRSITGANALVEGDTENPLAIIAGPPNK